MAGVQGLRPRRADAAGQALFFEAQPDRIPGGVGQVSQPVRHSQDEEDRGVDAHRHARVTLFDPRQSIAADKCPFGHERRGQSPPPAGGGDVQTQLRQCASYTEGKGLSGSRRFHASKHRRYRQ